MCGLELVDLALLDLLLKICGVTLNDLTSLSETAIRAQYGYIPSHHLVPTTQAARSLVGDSFALQSLALAIFVRFQRPA